MRKYVVLSIALLMITGCAVNSTSSNQYVTNAVKQTKTEKFDDIPIYPGFNIIREKSIIYESGNIKVGRLVFRGDASINDVVDYYKTNLPENGWEPISITIYENDANLTYVTSDRVLQIRANRGFSGTTLIIQVGPRGELTAEPK